MFDATARLVVCNELIAKCTGYRPRWCAPGCSLRDLLGTQEVGTFSGDAGNTRRP